MKIFAFTDLHESLSTFKKIQEKIKKEKPDLIVCAGDFTVFEQHINEMMQKISSLGNVFLIHGNHETEAVTKKLCEQNKITFIHKKIKIIDDYVFVGFGSGGFDMIDKEFEHFIEHIKNQLKGKKVILVTHAPFYDTKIDFLYKQHRGNKSYTKFIKNNSNVILGICGHFHETFKKRDKINQATVINPGADGEFIEV
ncbi:metallophosphoesterase family protein [archaeon]|nr:metallophosphoesterase family protein [archaeon]